MSSNPSWGRPLVLLASILLLAICFAQVEIQIEGGRGWASGLPTWRIEKHLLLDLFWGGRSMTGYHAWVFSFMFFVFHLPQVMAGTFSWRLEARCLGSLMLFWIIEDFGWFLMNPSFSMSDFNARGIPWHKNWFLGVPADYALFSVVGAVLLFMSFAGKRER